LNKKKRYIVSVLFDRISNPLERKALYIPPSPSVICLFHTPLPLGISLTLCGGSMDIFWNHTLVHYLAVGVIEYFSLPEGFIIFMGDGQRKLEFQDVNEID